METPPCSTEPPREPSSSLPEPTIDPSTPAAGIYYVLMLHAFLEYAFFCRPLPTYIFASCDGLFLY